MGLSGGRTRPAANFSMHSGSAEGIPNAPLAHQTPPSASPTAPATRSAATSATSSPFTSTCAPTSSCARASRRTKRAGRLSASSAARDTSARTLATLGDRVEQRRRAGRFLGELWQDAGHGFRLLRRNPGFACRRDSQPAAEAPATPPSSAGHAALMRPPLANPTVGDAERTDARNRRGRVHRSTARLASPSHSFEGFAFLQRGWRRPAPHRTRWLHRIRRTPEHGCPTSSTCSVRRRSSVARSPERTARATVVCSASGRRATAPIRRSSGVGLLNGVPYTVVGVVADAVQLRDRPASGRFHRPCPRPP